MAKRPPFKGGVRQWGVAGYVKLTPMLALHGGLVVSRYLCEEIDEG